ASLSGEQQRRRHRWWRTLFQNRTAVVGAVVILVFVIIAILAPVIAPRDPLKLDVINKLAPPSEMFPLGSDQFGRDVAARLIYGARMSMGVGLSVGVAAVLIGLVLGLLSGYYQRLDSILMRVMDALMAFPSIIFAIVLMGILG